MSELTKVVYVRLSPEVVEAVDAITTDTGHPRGRVMDELLRPALGLPLPEPRKTVAEAVARRRGPSSDQAA